VKYYATFYWTMTHTVEVEAATDDEAWEKAENLGQELNIDNSGEYLQDSFELDNLECAVEQPAA
jgi:hypothetical protein